MRKKFEREFIFQIKKMKAKTENYMLLKIR